MPRKSSATAAPPEASHEEPQSQAEAEESEETQERESASGRVLGVASDLKNSIRDLWQKTRDQVVMVRVDRDTTQQLDSWVETGAVKSRSEAAALFIREGLELHQEELGQLGEALQGVEKAKEVLREKARQVFGDSHLLSSEDADDDGDADGDEVEEE